MLIIVLSLVYVSMILLTISSVLSAVAAGDLNSIPNPDSSAQSAYMWLSIGTGIAWVTLIVASCIFIYLIYAERITRRTQEVFLFFLLLFLIVIGIMFSVAASDIGSSSIFKQAQANESYRNTWVSALLALGGGGLIVIGIIAFFTYREVRTRRAQARIEGSQVEMSEVKTTEVKKTAGLGTGHTQAITTTETRA